MFYTINSSPLLVITKYSFYANNYFSNYKESQCLGVIISEITRRAAGVWLSAPAEKHSSEVVEKLNEFTIP